MGLCKDRAVTYLNGLGYNVIRHPRVGLTPLMLIGRQNRDVSVLGDLQQLITEPPTTRPEIAVDQAAAGIEGQRSSELTLGVGLNILGTVLGAMGGNLGVDVAYKRARTIKFEFANVTSDTAKPLDIGSYLRDGDVDAHNLVLQQYVLGNGELYVVTEVVRSDQLSVVATRKDGTEVSVDVPVVQEIVGGKVSVATQSAGSSTVTYSGTEKLAFGFKCYRIGIEDGVLSMMAVAPSGAQALSFDGEGQSTTSSGALLGTDGLLSLGA